MSNLAKTGEAEFENDVLRSDVPVVVDFYAEWCPPCKMIAPTLDRIAEKYAGRVKIVKCDIDDNPRLAEQYGIQSIPNLLFFRDGQVVDQTVGYSNEAQLTERVERIAGQVPAASAA